MGPFVHGALKIPVPLEKRNPMTKCLKLQHYTEADVSLIRENNNCYKKNLVIVSFQIKISKVAGLAPGTAIIADPVGLVSRIQIQIRSY